MIPMETIELKRDCEAIAIPSGLRQTLPQGTAVRIVQARGGSYTVSTNIHAMYRVDGADDESAHKGPLSEQLVWDTLKTIYDPELPVNVVDLGLIYSCSMTPSPLG